jgi:hypothetical protein
MSIGGLRSPHAGTTVQPLNYPTMPDGPTAPALEAHGVVVRGYFNPAIFQPAWFLAEGLMTAEEIQAATIDVIHPSASMFSVGDISLQVTRDSFSATSSDIQRHVILKDLVAATFDRLRHTPIVTVSLHHDYHFDFGSADRTRGVQENLAPIDPWSVFEDPQVVSITVRASTSNGQRGDVVVAVEPSVRVEGGLYVGVHDNFDVSEDDSNGVPAGLIVDLLETEWEKLRERSLEIAYHLIGEE